MGLTKSPYRSLVNWLAGAGRAVDSRLGAWLIPPIQRRIRSRRFAFLRPYARSIRYRMTTMGEIPGSKFTDDHQAILAIRSHDREVTFAAYLRDWRIHRVNRLLDRLRIPISLLAAYIWFGTTPDLPIQMLSILGSLLSLPIALIVFTQVRRSLIRFDRNRLLNLRQQTNDIFTALLTIIVAWLAFQLGRSQLDLPIWIVAGVAFGLLFAAFDTGIWLTRLLFSDIQYFIWASQGFQYAPDDLIASYLMSAIVEARSRTEHWSDLRSRRSILYDIEMCARCIDYYLPRALRPYDHDTWTWQMAEGRRIAGAIRKLKTLLIMPAPDSREKFLQRATETLYSIAVGDWSSLEQVESVEIPAVEPRLTLRRRIAGLLSGMARALTPLALAIAATQVTFGSMEGPLVTGGIANYLLGATALYAALVLIMAIDPELASRVRVAREILGMTAQDRPGGEGKGTGFEQ
jgi:hypothetical protein